MVCGSATFLVALPQTPKIYKWFRIYELGDVLHPLIRKSYDLGMLNKREFNTAICAALRAAQMAENRKNRDAIFTIFRFRRTDVK